MKKHVKWILTGAVLLAGVIGMVFYMTIPADVELFVLERKDAVLYFIEQGYVKSDEKVDVYPLAQGEIIAVYVEENQFVEQGDVLCVIDTTALETQKALLQSEISGYAGQNLNLDLAEQQEKDSQRLNLQALEGEYAALLTQENDIDISKEEQVRLQNIVIGQNRNELARVQEDLERAAVLYQNDIIPKTEYDQYVNSVTQAEAALESSLKQLDIINAGEVGATGAYLDSLKDSLKGQIDSINGYLGKSYTSGMKQYYAALAESASAQVALIDKQIGDAVVKAPVSGEITSLYIKNTNIASNQTPVASIAADKTKEIELYISTKDISEVALGDEVEITFQKQTGDVVFTGSVIFIDNEASLRYSALGVEERRVRVLVEPNEPSELDLKSGYDVDVKFTTYKAEKMLTAPKTAFYKADGKDYVFVIEDGKMKEAPVALGVELRTEYVILSGVSEGDYIVKDVDKDGIREGVRVNID